MDDFDPVTYEAVNDAWRGVQLPVITAAQSTAIFAKLVRKFGGKRMNLPGYFYRTNRSWASTVSTPGGGRLSTGLPRMVHDASHWVHESLHRGRLKTHCHVHAEIEKSMIEHVVAKGLHLPKAKPAPKPKPTPGEARSAKLDATHAAIKRWETKAKRAATALRKLRARERGLARAVLLAGGGPA